jgi:hypothetical protein
MELVMYRSLAVAARMALQIREFLLASVFDANQKCHNAEAADSDSGDPVHPAHGCLVKTVAEPVHQ